MEIKHSIQHCNAPRETIALPYAPIVFPKPPTGDIIDSFTLNGFRPPYDIQVTTNTPQLRRRYSRAIFNAYQYVYLRLHNNGNPVFEIDGHSAILMTQMYDPTNDYINEPLKISLFTNRYPICMWYHGQYCFERQIDKIHGASTMSGVNSKLEALIATELTSVMRLRPLVNIVLSYLRTDNEFELSYSAMKLQDTREQFCEQEYVMLNFDIDRQQLTMRLDIEQELEAYIGNIKESYMCQIIYFITDADGNIGEDDLNECIVSSNLYWNGDTKEFPEDLSGKHTLVTDKQQHELGIAQCHTITFVTPNEIVRENANGTQTDRKYEFALLSVKLSRPLPGHRIHYRTLQMSAIRHEMGGSHRHYANPDFATVQRKLEIVGPKGSFGPQMAPLD